MRRIGALSGAKTVVVMRTDGDEIEVAASTDGPSNTRARFPLAATFCGDVVSKGRPVEIEASSPDRIAYFGVPVRSGEGPTFGTLCIYDAPRDRVDASLRALMESLAELVASHLELERRHAELEAAHRELRELREIVPVCAHCHDVRDDQGYWRRVEDYLASREDLRVSHGICPTCVERHFPEFAEGVNG